MLKTSPVRISCKQAVIRWPKKKKKKKKKLLQSFQNKQVPPTGKLQESFKMGVSAF